MKLFRSDAGNVIVEFIGITVGLLVPLSIVANSSLLVANAYLATDVAARTAARAFVVSENDVVAFRSATSAARLSVDDFGSGGGTITTQISCSKKPCLSPGGFVTVKISKEIILNLPKALGTRSVLVTSQHTSGVDELRAP
jgi:hypothetical protein